MRDRWVLFVHNWIRGPVECWRDRRLWIRQGLDPVRLPGFGRVDLADLDWARGEAAKITTETAVFPTEYGVVHATFSPDVEGLLAKPSGALQASCRRAEVATPRACSPRQVFNLRHRSALRREKRSAEKT